MNGELRQITVEEMKWYIRGQFTPEQAEYMIRMGGLSYPLLVGTYDGRLLCLVGLVPPSMISDTAYIWCYDTAEVQQHKVMFGRYARRLVAQLRQKYSRIVGHCLNDRSRLWLASLGATFTETTFEIVSWPPQ